MITNHDLPRSNSDEDPAQDGKVHITLFAKDMDTSFVFDPKGCSVLIAPGGYAEPYVARWKREDGWDSALMHDDEFVEQSLRAAVEEWREHSSTYVTKTGHVITEDEIAAWVSEAEAGYDVSKLRDRRADEPT